MEKKWIAPSEAVAGVAYRVGGVLAAPTAAYEPFVVAGHIIGWITPDRVQRLAQWRDVFHRSARGLELAPGLDMPKARTSALAEVARTLSAENALTAWRDERYAVIAALSGPTLFEVERAAARYFGIHTLAAHANGLVGDDDRWQMWLARRSPTKAIDPGLLDNLVGGGIRARSHAPDPGPKEAW